MREETGVAGDIKVLAAPAGSGTRALLFTRDDSIFHVASRLASQALMFVTMHDNHSVGVFSSRATGELQRSLQTDREAMVKLSSTPARTTTCSNPYVNAP
jgi:hypothetical protein